MARTPDRTPGPSIEEELQLEDNALDPSVVGAMTNNAGVLKAQDSTGIFDIRGEEAHKSLRQLIHFINGGPAEGFATGAFRETLPSANPFPTSVIWWESNAKLEKIVEKTIAYTGVYPTTIVWKMYDIDGSTLLVTVTDTISYSGPFETSRTRAIA